MDNNIVDDDEEGQEKFLEMNKEALDKGFEGLMIKPSENYYEWNYIIRSLKCLPVFSYACKATFKLIIMNFLPKKYFLCYTW